MNKNNKIKIEQHLICYFLKQLQLQSQISLQELPLQVLQQQPFLLKHEASNNYFK